MLPDASLKNAPEFCEKTPEISPQADSQWVPMNLSRFQQYSKFLCVSLSMGLSVSLSLSLSVSLVSLNGTQGVSVGLTQD